MTIEVDLTESIVNECLPLHYRYAPFKQKYLPLLLPVAAVAIIGIGLTLSQPSSAEGNDKWIYLYIYAPILILFTIWSIYKRNRAGRKILKRIGDNSHYTVEANEDGLSFQFSHTSSNSKWPAFSRTVLSAENVLLYQQNGSFLMFHHTFFANEDFTRFKQLLRSHVYQVTED